MKMEGRKREERRESEGKRYEGSQEDKEGVKRKGKGREVTAKNQ